MAWNWFSCMNRVFFHFDKFIGTTMSKKLLGEMLVEAGEITQAQLDEALAIKETSQKKIGVILLELGYLSKEALMQVIATQSAQTISKSSALLNNISVPDSV